MKTVKCIWMALLLVGLGAAAAGGEDLSSTSANPFSTIHVETRCEAMVDNVCPGRFGFTVDNQGNFTAGPDSSGKTTQGVITPAELESLANSIVKLSKSGDVRGCSGRGTPGVALYISVVYAADGRKVDISFAHSQSWARRQGDECLVTPQRTRTVQQTVRKLLTKYYPVPFSTEN